MPLHSFDGLLDELGTCCQNACRLKTSPDSPTFTQATGANAIQRRALGLIEKFPVTDRA